MMINIISAVLLISGLFFMAVSVLGVFRFESFFSRLQVMGVGQALGTILCCLGLCVYDGLTNTTVKILIVMMLTLVGGPIGTHIIDKVAYKEAERNCRCGEAQSVEEEER